MLIAYSASNNRIFIDEALAQEEYFCPSCKGLLITKKGEIRRHHFSHKPGSKCTDTWYPLYDTSEWHYDWQSRFPKENQEIVLRHEGEIHRADVLTGRTVVVFQHCKHPIWTHPKTRSHIRYKTTKDQPAAEPLFVLCISFYCFGLFSKAVQFSNAASSIRGEPSMMTSLSALHSPNA